MIRINEFRRVVPGIAAVSLHNGTRDVNGNELKEIQMCVPGLRSRVKTEDVTEVGATEKPFPEIAEPQPKDFRNASLEAGDGATFVSELEKQEDLRTRALT